MSKYFEVNKNKYVKLPFDFNMVCELEENGVDMEDINKKPLKLVREYFAICAGITSIEAGDEIQKHIIGGGTLDSISDAMRTEIEKSDFFQSLMGRVEDNNQTEEK